MTFCEIDLAGIHAQQRQAALSTMSCRNTSVPTAKLPSLWPPVPLATISVLGGYQCDEVLSLLPDWEPSRCISLLASFSSLFRSFASLERGTVWIWHVSFDCFFFAYEFPSNTLVHASLFILMCLTRLCATIQRTSGQGRSVCRQYTCSNTCRIHGLHKGRLYTETDDLRHFGSVYDYFLSSTVSVLTSCKSV